MLQTYQEDECCGDKISEALRTEDMEGVAIWTCPKCGTEWRREIMRLDQGEEIAAWRPHCPVLVFKP